MTGNARPAILPDATCHRAFIVAECQGFSLVVPCALGNGVSGPKGMGQRSITDEEIALIKAMKARKMKNTAIQFFFNRPSRSVNSGRITGIAAGTYSNSAQIDQATEAQLSAFLDSQAPSIVVPQIVFPTEVKAASPVSEANLRGMFAKDIDGVWRLSGGETDHTECKENFGLRYPGAWLRALAAMANNRGGYIFFGVADKDSDGKASHHVVGMGTEEFSKSDPADLAKRVRGTFDPTPRFETTTIEIGGKKVGVIHVDQHPSRPVIATKNDDKITEGDIFFRYPGTSTRINYSDLRSLLDARDAQMRSDILPMVERLLSLGPKRAMIADLTGAELTDGKRTIQIDESLIGQISFIKEGEFEEKTGAPTLRLIGNLEAVGGAGPANIKKGIVTQPEMLRDFLADQTQADPIDYIRFALEVANPGWLPVRYFAHAAGMSHSALLAFIDASSASPARKAMYKDRLSSINKALVLLSGPASAVHRQLLANKEVVPTTAKEARTASLAIQGLRRPLTIDPGPLKTLLTRCVEITGASGDAPDRAAARKGIARLDELLFA